MTLKNIDPPFGLDPAEVDQILTDAAGEQDLGKRIDRVSELLLTRRYIEGSLGGGADLAEELRVSLSAFDCVTFMESVLALALARTIDEFIDTIRRIRYKDGEIDWRHRNHYMVDWASNNEQSGFIKNITSGPFTAEKTCTLSLIAGLQAKTATFLYFPTQSSTKAAGLIESGDLIFFVSVKNTLDVFHTALLIEREGRWLLRHATRTAGAAIEQDLIEFTSRNEMAGFILLRPLCRH
ncbi:MAG TPA: N-acetylmuramoyl-L-alanine amidase-like domain-containing protein [Blastocatellia bacterium]|nr:N-acetylmuramoyl-L-alanine amidase-like domain-containing protein [Blastocatellia bacterium]